MYNLILQRIEALRAFMNSQGLSAFIFPSTDPHCGEYIPEHWETRRWISGFNGSAGTVVITAQEAFLWTDSRYYLAAEEQLTGTTIRLMKDGLPDTPSIAEWLSAHLSPGDCVGLDGQVNSIAFIERLQDALKANGISICTEHDPAQTLWTDRPSIPTNPVEIQPLSMAGTKPSKKIQVLQSICRSQHTDGIIISALDEVAWTLNLRGNDIHCNPVFVSYLLITTSAAPTLFINSEKLPREVYAHLQEAHVEIRPYDDILPALSTYPHHSILLNPSATNYSILHALPPQCRVVRNISPVAQLKAIKNEAEIKGFRQAMLRDGVAMIKFLKWLQQAVPLGRETEVTIDQKLHSFRAEQPHFKGISFDTIAGYGPHGAIVHYEATEETAVRLEPKGLLLLDSGAQYQDGTTDITRTIALGPLTEEEKTDYTLVLKGHINLARMKFPNGCSGTQLDSSARYAMWQHGINYGHGTGHGVGSFLNVHEGPHQIRMNYMPEPLRAGMTVTNEPGIYRAGKHGVRIENTLLIIPYMESEFGCFLQFEPLTLCPIDTTPVHVHMLSPEEISWLNDYHQLVYTRLAPLLDEEHRIWLSSATAPLSANSTQS
ncbi:MAG: aminopeptidase P family protein [Paraprevotella sp.]|nr:aminopeptidase P family protein [Paraprevotella sp.]